MEEKGVKTDVMISLLHYYPTYYGKNKGGLNCATS